MIEFIDLENKDRSKLIQDVLLYPLKVNRDNSGILIETLRKDWPEIYGAEREFSMQYFSVTDPWIARDEDVWHWHPFQEDRFLLGFGEVIAAIADNREDSQTHGLLNLFKLNYDKNPYTLLIPKKTLHGFMVISKTPAVLLNFPTRLYSKEEEGRVSHSEANVKFLDGSSFTWEKVREELQGNG